MNFLVKTSVLLFLLVSGACFAYHTTVKNLTDDQVSVQIEPDADPCHYAYKFDLKPRETKSVEMDSEERYIACGVYFIKLWAPAHPRSGEEQQFIDQDVHNFGLHQDREFEIKKTESGHFSIRESTLKYGDLIKAITRGTASIARALGVGVEPR